MRTAAVLAMLSTACLRGPPADTAGPQHARARAALAAVVVDNRSPESLAIFYRLTTAPASEAHIGNVPPDSIATMAPVPAAEPIILIARTPDDRELVLRPRTLRLDEPWVWRIARTATFTARRVTQ